MTSGTLRASNARSKLARPVGCDEGRGAPIRTAETARIKTANPDIAQAIGIPKANRRAGFAFGAGAACGSAESLKARGFHLTGTNDEEGLATAIRSLAIPQAGY